jgi:hypothetical protein
VPPPSHHHAGKVEPFLDHSITRHYLATVPDQSGKVIAEYVWIGGSGQDVRSKSRTLSKVPTSPEELPHWNYDGSSTNQAPGTDSEVYLIPRCIFRCVWRRAAAAGGVVWCGVVWCGVVWCGVVWCGVVAALASIRQVLCARRWWLQRPLRRAQRERGYAYAYAYASMHLQACQHKCPWLLLLLTLLLLTLLLLTLLLLTLLLLTLLLLTLLLLTLLLLTLLLWPQGPVPHG